MSPGILLACALLASYLLAAEKAAYDSLGRLIALLAEGPEVPVSSGLVAVLPVTGKRIPVQTRSPHRPLRRERDKLLWTGSFQLPDEGEGTFRVESAEHPDGLTYTVSITASTPLQVDSLEFVLDLPRPLLMGGTLLVPDQREILLPAVKPPDPVFFRAETAALRLASPDQSHLLDFRFDNPRSVSLLDRWDPQGRSYQLRIVLARGPLDAGAAVSLPVGIRLVQKLRPPPPARLALRTAATRPFLGFGGNYCWNNRSPVAAYTLENLRVAWARVEMKLVAWDRERDNPGPALRADFETMRKFQVRRIPYVISIWWLPERFYTDPHERPRMAHFRRVDPEKWDELADLIGSYLLYARNHYGVEPDLFSFNEANIGVYVGFTAEEHARLIKRLGAHFQKLGLKTKMLLGDATGPRDTHNYVLTAAADPHAMPFVGAVAFHSWGGATAAQYRAWGEVAEWLGLPLLVTELGVDAQAYHTRAWESYHYGLREARMIQEILSHARPQVLLYWQFTDDYSLVRTREDGAIEPTARFWLIKHYTDLTPSPGELLEVSSDQPDVLGTAVRSQSRYAIHLLNLGAARTVEIEGLPEASWSGVLTTESSHYRQHPLGRSAAGKLSVHLPARSLYTLAAQDALPRPEAP
ncbi:MAG: hypothetical protein RMI94_09905 [Bryobacterales bacterium]|nr:hypothetical protein [Bryobacteraceae bacterium]MDW8130850.1 hypothetical protein [Bryobacterales bacterium]